MKLIIRNDSNEFIKAISCYEIESILKTIKEINLLNNPANATLFVRNEKIKCIELKKLKLSLEKLNINFINIYSNNRETVIAGNSLKINSSFIIGNDLEQEFCANHLYKVKNIVHKRTIRSGDRISSNGDLLIIGDVNPGAIISAQNNIYVWGKLLGIASAGQNGDQNASVASLYLNPLQLRICEVVAIGPKEKPKSQIPEVAVLENQKIIIKPYLI